MRSALKRNWFLIGLAVAVTAGVLGHGQLDWLAQQKWLRSGTVFIVLLVMTLPLKAEAIMRVIRHPFPALLASTINMGLIPPLAWLLSPLLPLPIARGLIVAAATPCTVASAAVWTRKAGGNDAIAIMVTVITNVSCFAITPAWVWLLAGQADAEIPLGPMIVKLALLVLLPMVLAQVLRFQSRIADFATKKKGKLGIVAQAGILLMVLIGSIQTGNHLASGETETPGLGSLLLMIVLVTLIHLAALAAGWNLGRLTRLGRADQIAVAFGSSQKTLLVGLTVAMEVQASILPMILYHVSQLIVDTIIADRMARRGESAGD